MNKIYTLLLLFFTLVSSVTTFAQTPVIEWDETLGGSASDRIRSSYPTTDGGLVVAGISFSNASADKSEDVIGGIGLNDYWVIKLDANGDIEWENTIGGESEDIATVIRPTLDGGYIVGGYSSSPAGFDKTEGNLGVFDYWIVKLDANGLIQWDETLGGSDLDQLNDILVLPDGDYVLCGTSRSPISGDKTEASLNEDVWLLKINPDGDIVWQNTIGGSAVDRGKSITLQAKDFYTIAAQSYSPISGDKTSPALGDSDYWILGVAFDGNLVVDWTLGGTGYDDPNSVHRMNDGSIIIDGESSSNNSAFKSEDLIGVVDLWVVKLTPFGDIIWDNTIGGVDADFFGGVYPLPTDEIILTSWSLSGVSGDKTEAGPGSADFWIMRLNPDGTINWQDTAGGSSGESLFLCDFAVNNDGTLYVAGSSLSGISGDKTEVNLGSNDYWVVKYGNILNAETNEPATFELLQNPVAELLEFSGLNESGTYRIYNLYGQLLKQDILDIQEPIDVSSLSSGAYIISIQTKGRRSALRFLKL